MKISNSKTAAAAHLSASLFSNHLREFVSELREKESEVVMGGKYNVLEGSGVKEEYRDDKGSDLDDHGVVVRPEEYPVGEQYSIWGEETRHQKTNKLQKTQYNSQN